MKKIAFRKMLLDKNLTYEKLAKKLGISTVTLVRYVNNDFNNMTIGTTIKMMSIFGKEEVIKVVF